MIFAVEQEKGNFKSRVFGGFNRHDVIDYIEGLARERNDLLRDNQNLRGKIEALEERLDAAQEQAEPDESDRDIAAKALEETRGILEDVRRQYDGVCGDLNINVTQAAHELGVVNAKLSALQDTLKTAGERLDAVSERLQSAGETENAEDL